MSPKSRKRSPKKTSGKASRQQAPADELGRIYRRMEPAFTNSFGDSSPLAPLVSASVLYDVLARVDPELPEPIPVLFRDFVATAAKKSTPAAQAMLRALAAVAREPELRSLALNGLRRLGDQAQTRPAWVEPLAGLKATRAWKLVDIYGDFIILIFEFLPGADIFVDDEPLFGGRTYAMTVDIDTNYLGGFAVTLDFQDSMDPALERAEARAAGDPHWTLSEISLAEARRVAESAMAASDLGEAEGIYEEYGDLRAAAYAHLAVIPLSAEQADFGPAEGPQPSEAQLRKQWDEQAVRADRLAAEFVRETGVEPAALQQQLAQLLLAYGFAFDDERPLRVSTGKILEFVFGFLPDRTEFPVEQQRAIPGFVKAWVPWAGARNGLPASAIEELLDELAPELVDIEAEVRRLRSTDR